jgi:polar amino acid transport system substrate-binding protein
VRTRVKLLVLLLLVAAVVAGAIVNRDEGGAEMPTTPGSEAGEELADACAKDELELVEPGVLTIGAAGPSGLPWLAAGDPAPEGFEPGIALAVGEFMFFAPEEVRWVDVAREDVLASGPQGVDLALGRIVPTAELEETMDFTEWYYDVEQAVLVPEGSELAAGATLAELREARLGAPAGPSHDAVLAAIQPSGETALFEGPEEALAALRDAEVDAVVIDYPTALDLLRGGETGAVAAGRLPAQGDLGFGLAVAEGSPLRACLSAAIANVRQQSFDVDLAQVWIEPDAPPLVLE